VVPKKQGKATERSGVRRKLREQFRIHPLRDTLEGCDLIFLANPQTHKATADQLRVALDDVLTRAAANLKASPKRNRPSRV
jgi:ribonuclease P protein component